jgi:hypothetical protein
VFQSRSRDPGCERGHGILNKVFTPIAAAGVFDFGVRGGSRFPCLQALALGALNGYGVAKGPNPKVRPDIFCGFIGLENYDVRMSTQGRMVAHYRRELRFRENEELLSDAEDETRGEGHLKICLGKG